MATRYECSNCGGIMVYDIKSHKLKCPNCSTERDIVSDRPIREHDYADYKKNNVLDYASEAPEEKGSTTMVCKSCGATIELSNEVTATTCPYCDSHIVLAEKQESAIIPDGISPFRIDKNEANLRFTEWIKGRWLAPSALKNLYQKDKFLAIYIPYWTFDAEVESYYTGEGGINRIEEYTDSDGNTKTRTVTDWYPTSGNISNSFDDVLVRAATTLDEKCIRNVGPFDTIGGLQGYAPEYMSGFSAERYTVPISSAHAEAVDRMENEMRNLARQDILRRYGVARVHSVRSNFYNETYKHIILPIYSTSYGFKGKSYNVLINGETGKVSGRYPKSYVKIGLIVVAVLIILAVIYIVSQKGHAAEMAYIIENQMNMLICCM